MTVKSVRGRRRYVAFNVSGTLTREVLIRGIPGGRRFNVIQCAEGWAIVRCSPAEIGECEAAVRSVCPDAKTVTVSGTLRTLRDRYPVLKRNAPPKPAKKAAPERTKDA